MSKTIKCNNCGWGLIINSENQTVCQCGKIYRAVEETPLPAVLESIETEARRIIGGERKDDYGSAKENFSNTALIWTGIIRARFKNANIHLDAQTVAIMMAAFKLCRESNKSKRDNRVDAIGYILLEEQILCPPSTT